MSVLDYNMNMEEKAKRYETFFDLLNGQREEEVAIIYDDNGSKKYISYKELLELIDAYPLKDKSSIGILCENNLETIVAIFAYAKAKIQIVLLNPLDDINLLRKQIVAGDVDYLIGRKELVDSLSDSLKENNIEKNGNILFFTSGTTSSNKAVVLSEESLCASAYNGGSLLPLKENDILLSLLPLSHVFGFVCSLLWGLSFGSKVALGRGLRHMIDDCSYFKPTVISLVPQIATLMASKKLFNSELKLVLIGAGPIDETTINLIKENDIRVSFGYGLTETSSGVALSLGDDPFLMSICPDDKIEIAFDGEILISSATCLMKGYYKNEEDTRKAVINDYLHTGDIGKIDERGFLRLLGRKKDILVLSDGTKIYCPEYEQDLGKCLPGLDFGVALIDNAITLFVYDEKNEISIEEKIKEFNQGKPRGQRISKIKILKTPLPRTSTGKIKRYQLEKLEEEKI